MKGRRLLAVAAAMSLACSTSATEPESRIRLRLTPDEQTAALSEMRVMLGSVQGIVQGIADSDREAIARFASQSGKRMARATPPSVVGKVPAAFAAIGEPMHPMFGVGVGVHFWPFDGWSIPAGRSAVVEAYPSLWKHSFRADDRMPDQYDAFTVASWLSEADRSGQLARYLQPNPTAPERTVAGVEGWILGVR